MIETPEHNLVRGWKNSSVHTAGLALYASAAGAASKPWQTHLSGSKNQSRNQPERQVLRQREEKKRLRRDERREEEGKERAPLSLQWFDKSYYFIISPWAES